MVFFGIHKARIDGSGRIFFFHGKELTVSSVDEILAAVGKKLFSVYQLIILTGVDIQAILAVFRKVDENGNLNKNSFERVLCNFSIREYFTYRNCF